MRVGFIAMAAGVLALSTAANAADQMIQSNELRASKIIGSNVYNRNNEKIGSVQDSILGTGGKVDYVVVDVGTFLGMGGKNVAVEMGQIKTDHERLTLQMTKNQLQQAPNYQLTDNNTGAGQTASSPEGGPATRPY